MFRFDTPVKGEMKFIDLDIKFDISFKRMIHISWENNERLQVCKVGSNGEKYWFHREEPNISYIRVNYGLPEQLGNSMVHSFDISYGDGLSKKIIGSTSSEEITLYVSNEALKYEGFWDGWNHLITSGLIMINLKESYVFDMRKRKILASDF